MTTSELSKEEFLKEFEAYAATLENAIRDEWRTTERRLWEHMFWNFLEWKFADKEDSV